MLVPTNQRGITILELLIGMAVGFIVVGGAITMYVATLRSSSDTLRASKLNQELGALMSVIVNDVRRAGYWERVGPGGDYHLNPFSQENTTVLTVIDDMTSNALQGPTGQGSCVVYSYDATYLPGNSANVFEATDLFGFRLNGTTVEMRQTGDVADPQNCANGAWATVTDADLIDITTLSFDLANSQCLNSMEPNGVDDDADMAIDNPEEADCYATVPAAASDTATVETREVLVTVTGNLAADPSMQMTMQQTVRVRNDHLRIR